MTGCPELLFFGDRRGRSGVGEFEQEMEMDIQIRAGPRPGEDGIHFVGRGGFWNASEDFDHGKQHRGAKFRIVTETKIEDGGRTPGKAHAQADSALVGAQPQLPSARPTQEAQRPVLGIGFGSLENQGLLRSGCPHQEFGRLPS